MEKNPEPKCYCSNIYIYVYIYIELYVLTWADFIIELFVLVHPDLHGAQGVVVEDVYNAPRPCVR